MDVHPSAMAGAAPSYQGYSHRSVSIPAVGRDLIALGPAAACLGLATGSASFAGSGTQAWIYASVFVALAIVAAVEARDGRRIRIPWFCVVVLAWPLVQLAPLGAIAARFEPQRAADFQMLSGLAVPPAVAISLYPYATAQSFLVLAGSVALFLLAREAGRTPGALAWLAAGILLLGLAEILPALRQWTQLQTGAAALATPGADFMRGTFGNRNLLCAWLEGCYGVALSLTLAFLAGHSGGRPGMRWQSMCWQSPGRPAMRVIDWLAILTAAGCVVVVAGSASRMGILTLGEETALLAIWQLRRKRRKLLIAGVLLAIVIGTVIGAGATGVAERFAPASLQLEKQGRLAMWEDSIRAVRLRPLTGAGLGCFPFAFRRSHPYFTGYTIDHPHNEYLEATVECGIPFTLLLGGWAAAGLWRRVRSAQQAAECHKEIALGCLAGVLGILAHSAVDFPLRIPAILGLVSVLLGAASAAARLGRHALPEDSPPAARNGAGWKRGWPAATVALGMAGVSLWSAPPADGSPRRLEGWNAEAYYRAARADFGQARLAEALDGYWQAVRANPYAALVWSDLALAAEAQGDAGLALRLSALAVDLEPHARWSQWAVGNLRLRLGDMAGALALLEPLVSQTPEMRRPVWEACWKAGMPGDEILARLTNKFPDDLEDYLRYLLDRGDWKAEAEACYLAESLGRPRPPERALREIFERLFRADQSSVMLRLWKLYAPRQIGFANGDFATPLRGYGLDWAVWPTDGVAVERRPNAPDGYRLDIDFEKPQNIGYSGVRQDFEVTPGRSYRLRFEAAADGIASSSGVQVDVMSLHRRLAASEAFRRSSGWKRVELRFTAGPTERVCRMRVVRPPCASFDNLISGRFSMRRVRLEEVGSGQYAAGSRQ